MAIWPSRITPSCTGGVVADPEEVLPFGIGKDKFKFVFSITKFDIDLTGRLLLNI